MLNKDDFFKVGHISKTHGVKGEMMLLCDFPINTEQLGDWFFFNIDACLIPFQVLSLRATSDKTLLFTCKGIEKVEDATPFLDVEIQLPVDQKQDITDSNAPHSLIGYQVMDENTQQIIGTVTDFIDSTHNPLLAINHKDKEILLPFQEAFILGLENEMLFVQLPDGLLDLE